MTVSGTPSKALNDNSFLFGLGASDIILLAIILILTRQISIFSSSGGLSLILVLAVGIALIPIRMRFRRKIIRNFISWSSEYVVQFILARFL